MKISSTLVAVYLVLAAGVFAAPVENAAAAAEDSRERGKSPFHWKKPIPVWSHSTRRTHSITRTLHERALETAGPTATTDQTATTVTPVQGVPGEAPRGWGHGNEFGIVTEHTYPSPSPIVFTPRPTILACDGRHVVTFDYQKCVMTLREYHASEEKKNLEAGLKHDNEEWARRKWEKERKMEEKLKEEKAKEWAEDEKNRKKWAKEIKDAEEHRKKEEKERMEKEKTKAEKKKEEEEEKSKKEEEKERARAKKEEEKKKAEAKKEEEREKAKKKHGN